MVPFLTRNVDRLLSITSARGYLLPSQAISFSAFIFAEAITGLYKGITCFYGTGEGGVLATKVFMRINDKNKELGYRILAKAVHAHLPVLLSGIRQTTSAVRIIKFVILDGILPFIISHFDDLRRQSLISGLNDLLGEVKNLQGEVKNLQGEDKQQEGEGQKLSEATVITDIYIKLNHLQQFKVAKERGEKAKELDKDQQLLDKVSKDKEAIESIKKILKDIAEPNQNVAKIENTSNDAEEPRQLDKEKVETLCKRFCDSIANIRKGWFSTYSDEQKATLLEIRDQLLSFLKILARNEETPYVQLMIIGLRDHDFMSIARGINWSSDDAEFLPVKFAEKGIFTKEDLEDKLLKHLDKPYDKAELRTSVIQLLNGKNISLEARQEKFKSLKNLISKVKYVALNILLVAYHGLVFHSIYRHPSSAVSPFVLLDAFYMGWSDKASFVYPERFIEGDFASKVNWILEASEPVAVFMQTFAYSCYSEEGLKSFPKHIYRAYCG